MKKTAIMIISCMIILSMLPLGAQAVQLIPGGQLIGLELNDRAVTVAAFDETQSAARSAGMEVGDRITHVDAAPIGCAADMRKALDRSAGSVNIRFLRHGKEKTLQILPDITKDGPRLGVYLRQGIHGVGTVTYYDPQSGCFGALGHSVNDPNGKLLDMTAGNAYEAGIMHIKKGQCGTPGQLMGTMDPTENVGSLYRNTPQGVFGKIHQPPQGQALETASADQVKTGPAVIRCTVENGPIQEYSVKILKIYPASRSGGRNMLIKVTDQALLDTTGGIIQGMSGSPILQDGKLIGAVTHVLVNDPTMGYGIFIENMLDAAA